MLERSFGGDRCERVGVGAAVVELDLLDASLFGKGEAEGLRVEVAEFAEQLAEPLGSLLLHRKRLVQLVIADASAINQQSAQSPVQPRRCTTRCAQTEKPLDPLLDARVWRKFPPNNCLRA